MKQCVWFQDSRDFCALAKTNCTRVVCVKCALLWSNKPMHDNIVGSACITHNAMQYKAAADTVAYADISATHQDE